MVMNLTKHGDRYAIIIDRATLARLRATSETEFEMIADEECILLRPIREPEDDARLREAIELVHTRFGRAMKRLAE